MTHDKLLLLGERLRSRRLSLGFTQESIANEVDISLRYYQMIERGERKVSLDTLIALSRILSISIDYLLFGDVSHTLDNPVSDLLNQLPPRQREDAFKILQLYANAVDRTAP